MNSNRSAFTLIEVLVTLAISSMILLIGSVSMKFMVTALSKNVSTLPMNAMTFFQVRSVIASTSPYVIYTKKPFDPTHFDYRYFFDGDSTKIRFITQSPIASSQPSIIELSLDKDRLIYKESPLYSANSDYLAPKLLADPYTFVVMDNLKNASWNYEINTTSTSTIQGKIPQRIKLRFEQKGAKNEFIFEIPVDSVNPINQIRRDLEVV